MDERSEHFRRTCIPSWGRVELKKEARRRVKWDLMQLQPNSHRSTMLELAREAGVSYHTLRRFFQGYKIHKCLADEIVTAVRRRRITLSSTDIVADDDLTYEQYVDFRHRVRDGTASGVSTTSMSKTRDRIESHSADAKENESASRGKAESAVVGSAAVVATAAIVTSVVTVVRNLIGSLKDSLDIKKHLREGVEKRSKRTK